MSRIYNLIVDERPKPLWAEYISPPLGEYEVELRKDPPTDRLSRAEEKLIHEIYEQFGKMNRWDLVNYVHTLPEWQDPRGSSLPISIRDILKAGGEDENEIRAVMRELRAMATAEDQLSPM